MQDDILKGRNQIYYVTEIVFVHAREPHLELVCPFDLW